MYLGGGMLLKAGEDGLGRETQGGLNQQGSIILEAAGGIIGDSSDAVLDDPGLKLRQGWGVVLWSEAGSTPQLCGGWRRTGEILFKNSHALLIKEVGGGKGREFHEL